MNRFAVILLLSMLLTGGAGAAPAEPGPTADHLAACKHYENRARFKSRTGPVEFVTMLAEACRAAQRSLAAPDGPERAAARVFLDRLVELRDVVVGLITRRAALPGPGPDDRFAGGHGGLKQIPGVSAAGEFLIAHRIGLVSALDDWLDSGAEFSLALR
jgi:hypothetical protein